ncbi:MAG: SOS response-associated peptidase [Fimbriimonadaceae bacterium]|nr:SOS response-associated peptidase [Fimbriimonadaceae bacterium]
MCARFTQFGIQQVQQLFGLVAPVPDIQDRYNIAPSAAVPVVRWGEQGRELALMQWGLVPPWADDPKIGTRMINARSETVGEKPSFRAAFKRRRCLIPTSGFFEWTGPDNARQPYFITFTESPMAFAGLWETWERAEGYLETFTILTTHPNEKIAALHDRMPVVIRKEDFGSWLNPQVPAEPLFEPIPNMLIEYWPVDKRMGNPRNNDARVLERVEVVTQTELF